MCASVDAPNMQKAKQVVKSGKFTVRVPPDVRARMDAIVSASEESVKLTGEEPETLSTIVRRCVLGFLPELEKPYKIKLPPAPPISREEDAKALKMAKRGSEGAGGKGRSGKPQSGTSSDI